MKTIETPLLDPRTVTIVLSTYQPIHGRAIAARLEEIWPNDQVALLESDPTCATFELAGAEVTVVAIPKSPEREQLEWAASLADENQTDTIASLACGAACWIVGVDSKDPDQVLTAMILTRFSTVLAECEDCLGAIWGGSLCCVDSQQLLAAGEAMNDTLLPIDLWVNFATCVDSYGRCSLATTGLEGLGFLELEVPPCSVDPATLRSWAIAVTHHLVEQGLMPEDGDVLTSFVPTAARFERGPSTLAPQNTVLFMEFETEDHPLLFPMAA